MKSIIKLIGRNMLTGAAIVLGAIIMIIGVFAFESLTTTPGTAGNQSLGSQILSKLSSGGFDRTTDSLEAISDKVSLIPTSAPPAGNNGFTGCETKVAAPTTSTVTLTCSAGKSIRSHSATCSGPGHANCGITLMTINSLTGKGGSGGGNYGHGNIARYNDYSASILCCND